MLNGTRGGGDHEEEHDAARMLPFVVAKMATERYRRRENGAHGRSHNGTKYGAASTVRVTVLSTQKNEVRRILC